MEPIDLTVPVLIENTAGGGNAVLRDIANYGPLWEAIGDLNVGVCLDTCHAWAAGEDLETVVERIVALTGGIALVHCNDSRDPFDSSRDRHANLGQGSSPRNSSWAWCGRPVLRWWWRPPTTTTGKPATSPGCGSAWRG